MRYKGSLVKHLGLSMYGGAVPSVAELISNAWDADAKQVRVEVPFGRPLKPTDVVSVQDNGIGMTWEECQDLYLSIGRDRRAEEGTDVTAGGRAVMGRKGIGKLAGFGIARIVEVKTVRKGRLTHFQMDFEKIVKAGEKGQQAEYEPKILADQATTARHGTTIFLKDLLVTRAIDEDDFFDSMARRFAIFSNQFVVRIGARVLKKENIPLQIRIPERGLGREPIPGFGTVTYWFGFTEKPIRNEDGRGVAVMVRDKMAQTPFDFNLRGGLHGQHGLQYMTGEVYADELDAKHDYIGTDRQGIMWSEPTPSKLLTWGQAKLRQMLAEWLPARANKNERSLYDKLVFEGGLKLEQRVRALGERERDEARQIINKLATIESVIENVSRARDLVDLILRAFEDSTFFDLITALSRATVQERAEVLRLVSEFDVFETVKLAELARGRVGVIQQLRKMIDRDAPEKPDMQNLLFAHPWLIDPQWTIVEHEAQLESLLIRHFKLSRDARASSKQRVDFFCIGVRGYSLVVEVKRPSVVVGRAEVVQTMDYVQYLRNHAPNRAATGRAPAQPAHFQGLLIGESLSDSGKGWESHANNSGVIIKTWEDVFTDAERIHREFLNAIAKRSPDDARVQALAKQGIVNSARPRRKSTKQTRARKGSRR